MIQSELLNNGTLIKHYSDKNVLLLQKETGIKYSEPVDVVPCQYTYEETDEPIEGAEEDNTEDLNDEEQMQAYAEAGKILLGVSE